MDFYQYLQNPQGKYAAYFTARYRLIPELNDRYTQLTKGKNKDYWSVDYYEVKGDLYCHIKLPSETHTGKIQYDVVIGFERGSKFKPIGRHDVQFFSNSPAFCFTYAYTYNKEKMFPMIMKSKLYKDNLKKPAAVRNNKNVVGFEKSTQFAVRHLMELGMHRMTPDDLSDVTTKLNQNQFLRLIQHANEALDSNTRAQILSRMKKADQQKKVADNRNTRTQRDRVGGNTITPSYSTGESKQRKPAVRTIKKIKRR